MTVACVLVKPNISTLVQILEEKYFSIIFLYYFHLNLEISSIFFCKMKTF